MPRSSRQQPQSKGLKSLDQASVNAFVTMARSAGRKMAIDAHRDRISKNVAASILSAFGIGTHSPERQAKDVALLERHGIKVRRPDNRVRRPR
jgi:hypothetical protein